MSEAVPNPPTHESKSPEDPLVLDMCCYDSAPSQICAPTAVRIGPTVNHNAKGPRPFGEWCRAVCDAVAAADVTSVSVHSGAPLALMMFTGMCISDRVEFLAVTGRRTGLRDPPTHVLRVDAMLGRPTDVNAKHACYTTTRTCAGGVASARRRASESGCLVFITANAALDVADRAIAAIASATGGPLARVVKITCGAGVGAVAASDMEGVTESMCTQLRRVLVEEGRTFQRIVVLSSAPGVMSVAAGVVLGKFAKDTEQRVTLVERNSATGEFELVYTTP